MTEPGGDPTPDDGGRREVAIHDARAAGADDDFDRSLRPPKLADFVNQDQVTEQLGVFIEAARRRGEPLDHVLLAGPPGLGKTSLAHIIAAELAAPMVQTAGPALERKADVAAFLTALEPGSVFFIDEIHRLGRAVEETLYPAMEERRLPVVLGQGAGARTVTLDLPPFTLIGATTRTGPADHAAARPLRGLPPPRALRRGRPAADRRCARPRSSGSRSAEEGAEAIAEPLAGHPAGRQPAAAAGPRLRRGTRAGGGHAAVAAEALEMLEVDARASTATTARCCSAIADKFAGGPGRALDPRGGGRRGGRHDRGRLRALPAPAGADQANAARPRAHRARLRSTSGCPVPSGHQPACCEQGAEPRAVAVASRSSPRSDGEAGAPTCVG